MHLSDDAVVAAPRPPATLVWIWLANLLSVTAVMWFASELGAFANSAGGGSSFAAGVAMGLAVGWAAVVAWVSLNLRRRRTWAWSLQLMLLCLIVGLGSLPGLLWVPLLIAWCSPAVRDWFDPPGRRQFG